jgi:DNA-binding NarL/FixJ family response regulator
MTTRIILADDHKILRDGLRSLLESKLGMEVVAEAGDGRTAILLIKKHNPQIAIMDITMPDINGIEATRQICEESPGTKVIALSMHSDKRFVAQMLAAGAMGYLLKDCAFEELERAIKTVLANNTYVSPGIAGVLVRDYVDRLDSNNLSGSGELTPQERKVLKAIAEGKNTKEVAFLLDISVKTVETHRQHLMEKLNLHTTAQLTKYAIREGLTTVE